MSIIEDEGEVNSLPSVCKAAGATAAVVVGARMKVVRPIANCELTTDQLT